MFSKRRQQIRLQSHRTSTHALCTTDARLNFTTLGFLIVHYQNTRTTFSSWYICIYQRLSHHRATTDNLTCIFGQTTASINQLLHRCTDTCQEVGGFCHRFSCYGNHTFKQWLILLYSLIYGKCSTHILYHSTCRDRQCATCYLTAGDGINQLLFTSLRILHFQSNHLDTCIAGSNFCHQLNSIRLIIFNTDKCLINLYGLHQDRYTYHNFFCMFQH